MNLDATHSLSPDQPYFSLNDFCRKRFGEKVVRVPLSLRRTCPNRTDGRTGCIFCLPESYEPPTEFTAGTVTEQLRRGMERLGKFYKARKFIAYLQSGSNTAGPPDELAQAYREALAPDEVVALSISTRPDCFSRDILEVIKALSAEHEIWVELGVQTAHDKTLRLLNRGHDNAASGDAIAKLREIGVSHIVAHMILGLPGETEEQMHESFALFSRCGVHGFKIHHLQVIRGTPLEQEWRAGRIHVSEFDDYARLVVDVLERVPAGKVIHRLFGSVPERYLLAPRWPGRKARQLQRIVREFKQRRTFQGMAVRNRKRG